jgi:hypothetical protein
MVQGTLDNTLTFVWEIWGGGGTPEGYRAADPKLEVSLFQEHSRFQFHL